MWKRFLDSFKMVNKKGKKGSAIVMVVVMVSFAMILAVAFSFLATSRYGVSARLRIREQADLTAKSMADEIMHSLSSESNKNELKSLIENIDNASPNSYIMSYQHNVFGSGNVAFGKESDELYIMTVTTTYNGQRGRSQIRINTSTTGGGGPITDIEKMFKNAIYNNSMLVSTDGKYGGVDFGGGDIYLDADSINTGSGLYGNGWLTFGGTKANVVKSGEKLNIGGAAVTFYNAEKTQEVRTGGTDRLSSVGASFRGNITAKIGNAWNFNDNTAVLKKLSTDNNGNYITSNGVLVKERDSGGLYVDRKNVSTKANVTFASNTYIEGDVFISGDLTCTQGSTAIGGNLIVEGDLYLNTTGSGFAVDGSIYVMGDIKKYGGWGNNILALNANNSAQVVYCAGASQFTQTDTKILKGANTKVDDNTTVKQAIQARIDSVRSNYFLEREDSPEWMGIKTVAEVSSMNTCATKTNQYYDGVGTVGTVITSSGKLTSAQISSYAWTTISSEKTLVIDASAGDIGITMADSWALDGIGITILGNNNVYIFEPEGAGYKLSFNNDVNGSGSPVPSKFADVGAVYRKDGNKYTKSPDVRPQLFIVSNNSDNGSLLNAFVRVNAYAKLSAFVYTPYRLMIVSQLNQWGSITNAADTNWPATSRRADGYVAKLRGAFISSDIGAAAGTNGVRKDYQDGLFIFSQNQGRKYAIEYFEPDFSALKVDSTVQGDGTRPGQSGTGGEIVWSIGRYL